MYGRNYILFYFFGLCRYFLYKTYKLNIKYYNYYYNYLSLIICIYITLFTYFIYIFYIHTLVFKKSAEKHRKQQRKIVCLREGAIQVLLTLTEKPTAVANVCIGTSFVLFLLFCYYLYVYVALLTLNWIVCDTYNHSHINLYIHTV